MSKLELYLSYLKNHISIVASLEYCPCINSLQYYKGRKMEFRSHFQEDWMKYITKEDIEKAKQDFKVIFEEAESLKSNINERFLDVYDDEDMELEYIDLVDQKKEVEIKLDTKLPRYTNQTKLLVNIRQNPDSESKSIVFKKILEKNSELQKELEDTFNVYETLKHKIAEIEERHTVNRLVYDTQKNECVELMKLIEDSYNILTKISDLFARVNMAKVNMPIFEMCEKVEVHKYEEIPVMVVTHGYRSSTEEDLGKWSQVCVRPTTSSYGYNNFFQEKTVQEHEEISEPVLLKSYTYWKKIRKKKIPRTQIGPSDEDIVYLQKKTENNQSEWEKVPRLKWTSHRK
ncbi:unnamed protein product, partial [Meganyctiphanes norvegica]